ncbi:MAG: class I SAM-dependent methyltransferase [Phycisphaerae bacterium]
MNLECASNQPASGAGPDHAVFAARFVTREQAERYRDRYRKGRHVRIDRIERAILRDLLGGLGRFEATLDVPSGSGRLSPLFGEVSNKLILADTSPVMLEMAREEVSHPCVEYLETDIRNVSLPDGSVDMVFCHRLLHHIHNADTRARIFSELSRVTRRYAILSYYSPGLRTRWRWFARRILGRAELRNRPAPLKQFMAEAAAAGLRPIRQRTLRRFPFAAVFVLFEKG